MVNDGCLLLIAPSPRLRVTIRPTGPGGPMVKDQACENKNLQRLFPRPSLDWG